MTWELSFADTKKPYTPHHTEMLSNRKRGQVEPFHRHRDRSHRVGLSLRGRKGFLGKIGPRAVTLDLGALVATSSRVLFCSLTH
jgi:hypothetical protein